MVMKQRGGTKQNQKGMLNVFSIYIFLIRNEVKDLEFALAKLRGLCKYLASVYNSHSHVLRTPPYYFCARKARQKNQCNEASRPSKELSVIST